MGKFLLADIKAPQNVSSTEYAVRFLAECQPEEPLPVELSQAIHRFRQRYKENNPCKITRLYTLADMLEFMDYLLAKRGRFSTQAERLAHEINIAEIMGIFEEHMPQVYGNVDVQQLMRQLSLPVQPPGSITKMRLRKSLTRPYILPGITIDFLKALFTEKGGSSPGCLFPFIVTLLIASNIAMVYTILDQNPQLLMPIVILYLMFLSPPLGAICFKLFSNFNLENMDKIQLRKDEQPKHLNGYFEKDELYKETLSFNSNLYSSYGSSPSFKPEPILFFPILETRRQLELEWMELDPKFCKRNRSLVPATT